MILSLEYLRQLLDESLGHIDAPEGFGAVLEGSIAEGFGNDSSDIDFLLLDPGEHAHPTMPTVLFIDGRRVEIRIRSAAQVREQAERVLTEALAGPRHLARITLDELDRCQRLLGGIPLLRSDLVESVRAVLSPAELAEAIGRWCHVLALRSARYAVALLALGAREEAVRWARTAVLRAAKTWAVRHGETYLGSKWISQQLGRISTGEELSARLWALLDRDGPDDLSDDSYVKACLELAGEFGVADPVPSAERVQLAAVRTVTTWQLGESVHVVRGRRDVFVLRSDAARVWRSLAFHVPLPVLLESMGPGAAAGPLIAQFHRLGLIGLRWQGGGEIALTPPTTLSPSAVRPVLSVDGAVTADDGPPVSLVPLPARRFAAAGMSLVWSNVMVENAREDMIGALAGEQWGVFSSASHRMLRKACVGLLAAYGINPVPAEEEAPLRVREIPELPPQVGQAIDALESDLKVADRAAGTHRLDALDAVVRWIRDVADIEGFPSSFVSPAAWRETLDIGYDWVRLGAYLDADFPIEEARDLLASGGSQPGLKPERDQVSVGHAAG
ncbi:hypothetical protein AB0D14_16570 [Streptomyces sp. NPDC048484]|uniref:hypothetical protein n=1 Tax=Streptomyces sp. NPDC048484 TaxID=3155146 RepID=UPI00343AB155